MKYSIITATYNASPHLENLIKSVIPQKRSDVEFIIIDGMSTDQTLDIINEYRDHIDYTISESDNGIYDAWNKGVRQATGDWIMFVGADDFLELNCLVQYDKFLDNIVKENFDYISSKAQMLNKKGEPTWVTGERWSWPLFRYKMMVAHPGSLHSKRLFQNYGLYDSSYRITGDYELLLRAKSNLKAGFLDAVTVYMTEGGVSSSGAAIKEFIKASSITGGGNPLATYLFGFYMLLKANINRQGRRFGLNLNRNR